jgi:predicted nucleic acid-binding protein
MSGFLLDTNVISELVKLKPERRVTSWVETTDEALLYLSVLTFGEIRKGIAMLPQTKRRTEIESWLEAGLSVRFAGRILAIDAAIADHWGILSGAAQLKGTSLSVIDGLLAATALHHNLTLVTRNTRDVSATKVYTFNPWDRP